MFTPEEYMKAWLMYLAGAVLMIACWWYLTHFMRWRELKQLSRIAVVVLLVVPWFTDANGSYLAPAIIIALVDSLTHGGEAFWRAGTPLLIALIVSFALSLGWTVWRWRQNSKQEQELTNRN